LLFFGVAIAIAAAVVFWYTRCARSTLLVVASSLVAVVWQLGLLPTLGYALDPYSMLVPFLIFAIGMSHGAQKMNGIMQDIGRGAHRLVAARFTFRRLFLAGLTALLADAVGFAVLLVIDIQAIRELAIAASLGVGVLIFTNLILLPVLLSFTGVNAKAAQRSLGAEQAGAAKHPVWAMLDRFTQKRYATFALATAATLGMVGLAVSTQLRIGDLDPGAMGKRCRHHAGLRAAFDRELPGMRLARMPRGDREFCHRADRGQGLAAEPERPDLEQVLVVELGGGVAVDGEREIGGGHAAAVVGDDDLPPAAAIGEDIDPARTGVDRVLHEFLDHARGTLDHLACGDAVDDLFGELADGHLCGFRDRFEDWPPF